MRKQQHLHTTLALAVLGIVGVLLSLGDRPQAAAAASAVPGRAVSVYDVGRRAYALTDRTRREILTAAPNDKRRVAFTVHYPARVPTGAKRAPVGTAADDRVAQSLEGAAPGILSHRKSGAVAGAPIASGTFPVVVFVPGNGFIPAYHANTLEALARRGFIVVGISPSFNTAKGDLNNLKLRAHDHLTSQAGDVTFVLDALGNLDGQFFAAGADLAHVGAMGHSFGGDVVAGAARRDGRIDAVVGLDSITDPVRKPLLQIAADVPGATLEPVDGRPWYYAKIAGLSHNGFATELAQIATQRSSGLDRSVFGRIQPRRSAAIIDAYVGAFLEQHLRGRPAPLLKRRTPPYPEVTFRRGG